MSVDCLRTGDKASVHFKFVKHPEFLKVGNKLVFREGRTKAVGTVTKVNPYTSTAALISAAKNNKPVKMLRNEQRGERNRSQQTQQQAQAQQTPSSHKVSASEIIAKS
ncbi:GTPbinding protein 1like [Caligus rogercresseyi]|uniref:GTPbinding protein 1like n=1 Tax=Caligus rogercresseyi TaxID=217165 RepID=A0A7T8JU87_CALRO|nr:GTPbinding protein 1like [Caligus rogercresseyi]QQP33053.1 GTPbinding protein 1like [Caligus rogercresseyi]